MGACMTGHMHILKWSRGNSSLILRNVVCHPTVRSSMTRKFFFILKNFSRMHSSKPHPIRFRDPKDIVLRILYSIYILETSEQNNGHKPITLQNNSDEYMFLMLNSHVLPSIRSLTAAAYRLRPRFLCINDDIEESGKGGMARLACRHLLKWLLPWTAGFEK